MFDQGGSTSGGFSSELDNLLDEDVVKTLHIKVFSILCSAVAVGFISIPFQSCKRYCCLFSYIEK